MRIRRPLGLRTRATIAFGLVGLFASVVLSLMTYFVARTYLLDQRRKSAEHQAFANARLARSALRSSGVDVASLLTTIRGESGSDLVVRFGGSWFASSVAIGRDDIPVGLRQLVNQGHAGREVVHRSTSGLQLVVGTPITAVNGAYFEVFALDELGRTLALVRNALAFGAVTTLLAAAALGRYAAGRIVRPLAPVTAAAARIAEGDLETRLPTYSDADVAPLVDGFNAMAASLQARVERDARFASDVSHELRTPLAALRAGMDVIERRRGDLPESVSTTLDLMFTRVQSFEALVLDLLEISRFDANAIELQSESLEVDVYAHQLLVSNGCADTPVVIGPGTPARMVADRRRLAQALGNIITNASRYAGGITKLGVGHEDEAIVFTFDDDGPGVDPSERTAIFERFARGTEGEHAGSASGTGLGLALAVAHIELHGGSIEVGDAPGGGARFIVRIPDRDVPGART